MATGKKIIELCLEKAEIDAYNELIPMRYDYAFNNVEDYENQLV
jgi:hypothetical protein